MATRKRAPKQSHPLRDPGPHVSRPVFPEAYGVPGGGRGLLPWSHVQARMARAKHYWVCTVGPDGRPHTTPVDGLWLDGALYFGGDPGTRWNRNLAANPAVAVHLESATDVIILYGEAPPQSVDRATAEKLSNASADKYGFGLKPEDYQATPVCVFRPGKVLAWSRFPKDATRWQFPATR